MVSRMEKDVDNTGNPVPPIAIAFRLDSRSGVPTYLQLVQQVKHAIRLGYLEQGDQLPTVRDVVASLLINPNTVLKAYRELERKGLVEGRPGQGTFVTAAPQTVGSAVLSSLRTSLLNGWMRDATAAGLDEEGISALFISALRDIRAEVRTRKEVKRPADHLSGPKNGGRDGVNAEVSA